VWNWGDKGEVSVSKGKDTRRGGERREEGGGTTS
jgi:hypothetical protein